MGPEYRTDIANSNALNMWGRTAEEVMNIPILKAMPELEPQGIKALLDGVYKTGNRFAASELPIEFLRDGELKTRYINFSYEVLYSAT